MIFQDKAGTHVGEKRGKIRLKRTCELKVFSPVRALSGFSSRFHRFTLEPIFFSFLFIFRLISA
jgi:hypothetical protein